MSDVTFRSYERPGGTSISDGAAGRPTLTLDVTATGRNIGGGETGTANRPVQVTLHGPGDVNGLRPGAIVGTYPRDRQTDVETSFCPWVEFAAPDLAWRYSPTPPAAGDVIPWMALLVVKPEEVTSTPRGTIVTPTALAAQRPTSEWALDPGAGHVQGAANDPAATCRIVCRRLLEPDTDYRALLVPAFDADGRERWANGSPGPLPVYHQWRFRTGAGGDFASLAIKLRAANDQDQIGRLHVEWSDGDPVPVRGALTGIQLVADDPVSDAVRNEFAELITFDPDRAGGPDQPGDGFDEDGRRYVRPPTYGRAWTGVDIGDAPRGGWYADVNRHPAHRVVAGLGRRSAVELQEEIATATAGRLGGVGIANQRLAALSLGLAVTHRLWTRLPDDPAARIGILGVAAGAILTDDGAGSGPRSLLSRVSGTDRTLPPGLFSTAARRILRSGASRFRRSVAPEAILAAANEPRVALVDEHDDVIRQVTDHLAETGEGGGDVTVPPGLLPIIRELPVRPSRRPASMGALRDALDDAFAPGDSSAASLRVRATIEPDDGTVAPRDPEVDLDLPAWRHLRDHHREWLFPGAHTLTDGEVVGLATNPQFVDALLVGLNTQALEELRWRNMPVASRSTPLRRFWDRSPIGTSDGYDIVTIREWTEQVADDGTMMTARLAESIGADSHGIGDRRHLVVAMCTDLFRRYPGTMVYLATRVGDAWLDADTSEAARTQPVFSARVTPKIVLYAFEVDPTVLRDRWVVVEQQPPGFRFRLTAGAGSPSGDVAGDAATRAAAMLEQPVRVFIAGDSLAGSP